MHAYVVPGASPLSVLEDARVTRLLSAGPWMAQMHPQGSMIVPKTENGMLVHPSELGEPRTLPDGLIYLPPKKLPPLDSLMLASMRNRDEATDIRLLREEEGLVVRIVPAYASPRKILEDNRTGGFSTRYGRLAREVLEIASAQKPYAEYREKFWEVCRLAIMHVYPRVTRELITEYGLLDEDSVFDIWGGIVHVPKELKPAEGASSASP